jgi:pimeloyl-ACP methyl ester carboxylesterase
LELKNSINEILDALASQQRQGETSLIVSIEPNLIQDTMNALRDYRKLFVPVIAGVTDPEPIYAAYEQIRQADPAQHTILLFVECQTIEVYRDALGRLPIRNSSEWRSLDSEWRSLNEHAGASSRPFCAEIARSADDPECRSRTMETTPTQEADLVPGPLPNSPVLAPVKGLQGAWAGDVGLAKLKLVLHVVHVSEGVKAALDSPYEGASGLPVTLLERDGDKIAFALEAQGIAYKGNLSADGQVITGGFTQGGRAFLLDLKKRNRPAAEARPRRPQEEAIGAAPLPYREEDVIFDNPAAPGVKLAGTLTLPDGSGPFPTVVLVSGSGPQGRNQDVAGHKTFLVLADYLTRNGLAVLRYDKRGVAKSTGNHSAATTDDFALDAEAAVAYLQSRPEVDGRKLGMIGHSEGGLIAPMVAIKGPSLAFIVMMAGPGVPGRILLAEQARLIQMAGGMSVEQADASYARRRQIFDSIVEAKNSTEAQARTRAIAEGVDPKPPQAAIDELVNFAASAWGRRFLAYDPVPTLMKVRVPTLVLNGSLDLQVPPSIDLPPIREAMAKNPDLTVIEMESLNHLFQHAITGSLTEYAHIEETLAPELLDTLSGWIGKHVR